MMLTLRSVPVFLAAMIAVWVGGSGSAFAEYSLCNKTSYVISAAIGYEDGQRLSTRGWWRLRPGQCQLVLNEQVRDARYFVYAEALPAHRGKQKTWSGDVPLCVEESGFFTLRNQAACQTDARRQRFFSAVDVSDATDGDWRTDFTEEQDFSVISARAAGMQRLLNDLGYDVGDVDGNPGRRTQLELQKFKREYELSGSDDDEVVDALVRLALERETKLGLFMCNDTEEPVWAALAERVEPESEAYEARGWWRLEAESCSKVIKDELGSDHYYVYAALDTDGGDLPLDAADRTFCVSPVKFEIEGAADCEAEGFRAALFKRVEIGDAKSWTYRFRRDAFAEAR